MTTLSRFLLISLLALPSLAFAQQTASADRRPVNELLALHTINGAPERGMVLSVSTTSATKTGFAKGGYYSINCTTSAFWAVGSVTVTSATDGTAGNPIPANTPMWFLMPTDATAVSVLGSGSGTCTFNRWK